MRRPALSAMRAIQIIDRLAASPHRSFTMSEIMRDTDINVASCHSILAGMTEKGYLRRSSQKTYTLGPVLAAIGQAAFTAQPLIARARVEAKALAERIDRTVVLTAVAEDSIVAIFTLDGNSPGSEGLRVGQRVPFAPPLGAPFVAWSPEPDIDGWLDRRGGVEPALRNEWRQALELVRQRGFQITLRPTSELASVMAEIAAGRTPFTTQREWERYFEVGDRRLLQPDVVEPDEQYPVVLIAVPVFDKSAGDVYCLGFTGFTDPISGAEVTRLAQELLEASVRIMRGQDD